MRVVINDVVFGDDACGNSVMITKGNSLGDHRGIVETTEFCTTIHLLGTYVAGIDESSDVLDNDMVGYLFYWHTLTSFVHRIAFSSLFTKEAAHFVQACLSLWACVVVVASSKPMWLAWYLRYENH